MKRILSGIMLMLLLISMLALVVNVKPVKSYWSWTGTIHIMADGSVDPSDAPISTVDNVTYMLTDNIIGNVPEDTNAIFVYKDDIVVDGAGYTVRGTGNGTGINLSGRNNITIKNIAITKFWYGIYLSSSSGNNIIRNNITNNYYGIYLYYFSSSNSISGNTIADNSFGIDLEYSYSNSISGNNITANNYYGIDLGHSSSNSISGNNIANNDEGIDLYYSSSNSISGNTIANNYDGIYLWSSSSNSISGNNITANNYYGIDLGLSFSNSISGNNFINNANQTALYGTSINTWDNGYPSGGNYWSDYTSVDLYRGPYQNVTSSDGIGDTPYIIGDNNADHYPLMKPYGAPPSPSYALTVTSTVGGTTNPTSGTYSYTAYSSVQVTAIPKAGYSFDHWELDSTNMGSANPYAVLMNKNHTLEAIFSHAKPAVPVGGYSFPIGENIKAEPLAPYTSIIAILTIIFTAIKRKVVRKVKPSSK